MKVLQIIPSFGMGGAEKIVLNYLKCCDAEDVEMCAVSLCPPLKCKNDEEIENLQLPVVYLDKGLGFDLKVLKKLKKQIREYNPDVIHTHLHALKYVLLTGECKNRKVFHTIHSVPWNDTTSIDQKINKFCFRMGKIQAIALQDSLAEMVNQYYGIDNTIVVPNGIDIEQFCVPKQDLRKDFNIPLDAYVIGHVGSFKDAKNHIFLIDIFYEITKVNKNAYLLLIGDGEHRTKIENKIKELGIQEKVKMLGNRGDIPQVLKQMDVFCFPSTYEGFGLGVIEAQAAGIRTVMSDRVPIETVVNDSTLRLPLEAPHGEWVRAILNTELKGEKYTELSNYDIKNVIKQLITVYEK